MQRGTTDNTATWRSGKRPHKIAITKAWRAKRERAAALRSHWAATSAALASSEAYSCPKIMAQNRCCIDLRLAERQSPGPGTPQSVEQGLRAGIEILLDLVVAARRHLADGELARVVAAGTDELDQRLGIGDVAAVERRSAAMSLAARGRSRRRTRPGADSISASSSLEISARIVAS